MAASPQNTAEQLVETEGLVLGFFYALWKKTHKGLPCPDILLPHTVVYQDSAPIAWYFTSTKDSKIYRKKQAHVTSAAILDAMGSHKQPEVPACAWFSGTMTLMSASPRRKRQQEEDPLYELSPTNETKAPASFEFLPLERLRLLVAPSQYTVVSEQIYDGLLQKFVMPREVTDHIMQAVWSPTACVCARLKSLHDLSDNSQPLSVRMADFENQAFWLNTQQMLPNGSVAVQRVQHLCDTIVKHLKDTSQGQHVVARMQLLFKVDTHNRIWFMLCNSLRLDRSAMMVHRSPPPASYTESQRKGQQTQERDNRLPVDNAPFMCVLTGQTCPGTQRCEVSHKMLIQAWFAEATTLETAADRLQAIDNIPPAIRRANPNITRDHYLRVRAQPAFLFKTAPVNSEAAAHLMSLALADLARTISRPRTALASSAAVRGADDLNETGVAAGAGAVTVPQQRSSSAAPGSLRPSPVPSSPWESTLPETGAPDVLYQPGTQVPAMLQPKPRPTKSTQPDRHTGATAHTLTATGPRIHPSPAAASAATWEQFLPQQQPAPSPGTSAGFTLPQAALRRGASAAVRLAAAQQVPVVSSTATPASSKLFAPTTHSLQGCSTQIPGRRHASAQQHHPGNHWQHMPLPEVSRSRHTAGSSEKGQRLQDLTPALQGAVTQAGHQDAVSSSAQSVSVGRASNSTATQSDTNQLKLMMDAAARAEAKTQQLLSQAQSLGVACIPTLAPLPAARLSPSGRLHYSSTGTNPAAHTAPLHTPSVQHCRGSGSGTAKATGVPHRQAARAAQPAPVHPAALPSVLGPKPGGLLSEDSNAQLHAVAHTAPGGAGASTDSGQEHSSVLQEAQESPSDHHNYNNNSSSRHSSGVHGDTVDCGYMAQDVAHSEAQQQDSSGVSMGQSVGEEVSLFALCSNQSDAPALQQERQQEQQQMGGVQPDMPSLELDAAGPASSQVATMADTAQVQQIETVASPLLLCEPKDAIQGSHSMLPAACDAQGHDAADATQQDKPGDTHNLNTTCMQTHTPEFSLPRNAAEHVGVSQQDSAEELLQDVTGGVQLDRPLLPAAPMTVGMVAEAVAGAEGLTVEEADLLSEVLGVQQ